MTTPGLPTAPGLPPSDYGEIIARVYRELERARQKINEFFRECGKVISKLPGFIASRANSLLRKVERKFNEFMTKVNEWLRRGGQPARLSRAAKRFSDEVQAKVSAQAPIFRTEDGHSSNLYGDDNWQGAAANAYRETLNPQSVAFGGYADTTSAVSTALNDCAWAIKIFWGGVAAAIVVLIGGIIAGIALAETVIGGVAAVLAAIAVALAAVGTAYLVASNAMSSNASVFRTQANDNKAYGEDGAWPKAGRSLLTGTPR